MNLKWISTERNKERNKERKGLGEFYQIDNQKDQEIAECENNFQVIRFLKASKLEFNFPEKGRPKVGESDIDTVVILKYETKTMDYLRRISKERKNE